jgi:hypothetical protein
MTHLRHVPRTSAALLSLLLLAGCGDDDSAQDDREPPPPELTIRSVRAPGGSSWESGAERSLDLGCPPSRALLVQLGEPDPNGDARSLKNWLLRAPGGCGARERCGYVSFELSSAGAVVHRTDTALPSFGVAAADVTAPPGLGAGTYELRATLRRSDGSEFLLQGAPVTASVELTFTTPAGCAIDPGADAGSDAG